MVSYKIRGENCPPTLWPPLCRSPPGSVSCDHTQPRPIWTETDRYGRSWPRFVRLARVLADSGSVWPGPSVLRRRRAKTVGGFHSDGTTTLPERELRCTRQEWGRPVCAKLCRKTLISPQLYSAMTTLLSHFLSLSTWRVRNSQNFPSCSPPTLGQPETIVPRHSYGRSY